MAFTLDVLKSKTHFFCVIRYKFNGINIIEGYLCQNGLKPTTLSLDGEFAETRRLGLIVLLVFCSPKHMGIFLTLLTA